jgi:hypothetical protein
MLLVTNHSFPEFIAQTEALTVIQPGDSLILKIKYTALANCYLGHLEINLPESVEPQSQYMEINRELTQGEVFDFETVLATSEDREGFGDVRIAVTYNDAGGQSNTVQFAVWLSVFYREVAGNSSLPDPLREKLVKVVNYKPRNGHIFLADFVSFFNDFLNIEIPGKIANLLADEFALDQEGLPVDTEKYIGIIRGDITFYGIEKLELIYEEHCNESNDKFDLSGLREVSNPNV